MLVSFSSLKKNSKDLVYQKKKKVQICTILYICRICAQVIILMPDECNSSNKSHLETLNWTAKVVNIIQDHRNLAKIKGTAEY